MLRLTRRRTTFFPCTLMTSSLNDPGSSCAFLVRLSSPETVCGGFKEDGWLHLSGSVFCEHCGQEPSSPQSVLGQFNLERGGCICTASSCSAARKWANFSLVGTGAWSRSQLLSHHLKPEYWQIKGTYFYLFVNVWVIKNV